MIDDLETRAGAALDKGEEDLAREAAEAIAVLEDERTASIKAQAVFGEEIARLTVAVRRAQARLRELHRGQRVVTARDQVRKVGNRVSVTGQGALTDAEETLAKIESRQEEVDLADAAYAQMTVSDSLPTLSIAWPALVAARPQQHQPMTFWRASKPAPARHRPPRTTPPNRAKKETDHERTSHHPLPLLDDVHGGQLRHRRHHDGPWHLQSSGELLGQRFLRHGRDHAGPLCAHAQQNAARC